LSKDLIKPKTTRKANTTKAKKEVSKNDWWKVSKSCY
jgi:hypothetical protein